MVPSSALAKFRRRANVVLVDAPCSGWGVLRRNPDIKWRQSPASLAKMPEIQLRLLHAYAELVTGDGRLVYGVCTFRPEETTQVVERFLKEKPEFKAGPGGYVGPGPCDGFFMQVFFEKVMIRDWVWRVLKRVLLLGALPSQSGQARLQPSCF
jgi:16S rRNA C967 or C1407 C5-methylase (RsmB/RsmF family)